MSQSDVPLQPNAHVASIIITSLSDGDMHDDDSQAATRTDLDTHANMLVAGKHAYILAESGKTATVRAFSPDMDAIESAIVDCAVMYECPYSGDCFLLVARNAIYVPTMNHNLVPPVIMREAGIDVQDIPKIHIKNPDVSDHSLYFEKYPLLYGGSSLTVRQESQPSRICNLTNMSFF